MVCKSEYMVSILTFLLFNDYLIIDLLLFSHKMKNVLTNWPMVSTRRIITRKEKRYVFQDIKKRSKEK